MMNKEEIMKNMIYMMSLLTIYAFSKTHIMNNLIIIEMAVVTILMMMFMLISTMKMENYVILYFIIVSICESMVGLSLMIAIIRTHGNDYMKSMNIMKF